MRFEIFTLFPEYFSGPLDSSILKRAQASGVLQVGIHNIREFATDAHRTCDDAPYGGGAGMVMKAAPLAAAVESVLEYDAGDVEKPNAPPCRMIFLAPHGRTLNHNLAVELAREPRIGLICGHYEGVDERAIRHFTNDAVSVGDYVLTGGEPAAAVLIDCITRLLPGVLGNELSAQNESFSDGLLEAPQYTRPASWRGFDVPKVLLSGHHGEVEKWRARESLRATLQKRPDLVDALIYGDKLSAGELEILGQMLGEIRPNQK